ncbi:hypothetical protein EXIGLDRAFT_34729 [Exidia glandulosa HHB12029]|uniref:Uncharacterized protein n=1 Tax=Exidia glandulosa HHB12029 TaxID=1314781 RepID=A0A166ANP4_EXIGL|nr:hypothetical protein EXIGLDRAFT_34729 [Exidia glandulosa HHB12029]
MCFIMRCPSPSVYCLCTFANAFNMPYVSLNRSGFASDLPVIAIYGGLTVSTRTCGAGRRRALQAFDHLSSPTQPVEALYRMELPRIEVIAQLLTVLLPAGSTLASITRFLPRLHARSHDEFLYGSHVMSCLETPTPRFRMRFCSEESGSSTVNDDSIIRDPPYSGTESTYEDRTFVLHGANEAEVRGWLVLTVINFTPIACTFYATILRLGLSDALVQHQLQACT